MLCLTIRKGSNMYSVKTRVSFEAAHRLYDDSVYSEACRANLHGHSYYVTIYVSCSELTSCGMVVDFKLLKEIIRREIEEKYDHSCILNIRDPLCAPISKLCKNVHIVQENPTAEWMAHEFFMAVQLALLQDVRTADCEVDRVEVQETENNIAIYEE